MDTNDARRQADVERCTSVCTSPSCTLTSRSERDTLPTLLPAIFAKNQIYNYYSHSRLKCSNYYKA